MQNETSKAGNLQAAAEALTRLADAEETLRVARAKADFYEAEAKQAAEACDRFAHSAEAALLAAGFVRADHDRPTADVWNTDDLSAALDAHAASAAPSVPPEVAAQGVREVLREVLATAQPPAPTPRFVDALGLDAARAQVRPLVDALRSAMRLAGNAAQVFALHNEAEQLSAQCADASEALAHLSTFLHGLGKDSEQ